MFLLVRNFFGFFGTKVICSGFFAFFLPRGNFNSDAFSTFFCVGMFFFHFDRSNCMYSYKISVLRFC